jgi:hypothetical protein
LRKRNRNLEEEIQSLKKDVEHEQSISKKRKRNFDTQMQIKKEQNEEEKECGVCFEVKEKRSGLAPCGHVFCEVCAQKAYEEDGVCPICQQKIEGKLGLFD